jgi:hypothetical protein
MDLLPITDVDQEIINNFTCLFSEYASEQEDLRIDHLKIDLFLKEEALSHHLNKLVRTFLFMNAEKTDVIGFFSLYNEEVLISSSQKKSFKFKKFVVYLPENDVYPSVRLHKFAIDRKYQGKFVGEEKYSDYLIGNVFKNVRLIAENSGCMFISLEATDNSVKFYEDYDFRVLKRKNGRELPVLIFKVDNLF